MWEIGNENFFSFIIMCSLFVNNISEGLCAKRVYIALWADFYFLQDQANFWQTDLFWHEKHHCIIVFFWFPLRFWEIMYAKNSVFQGYLLEIFCWAKNKRNLCFAKRWSHRSVVFAASFIIHIITQFSYCCFVSTSG